MAQTTQSKVSPIELTSRWSSYTPRFGRSGACTVSPFIGATHNCAYWNVNETDDDTVINVEVYQVPLIYVV